jgi:hypothetical protein
MPRKPRAAPGTAARKDQQSDPQVGVTLRLELQPDPALEGPPIDRQTAQRETREFLLNAVRFVRDMRDFIQEGLTGDRPSVSSPERRLALTDDTSLMDECIKALANQAVDGKLSRERLKRDGREWFETRGYSVHVTRLVERLRTATEHEARRRARGEKETLKSKGL